MIWEVFRAEYLESRADVASRLLTRVISDSMSLQGVCHGAGQLEMAVQMVSKCIGISLRIVKQERCDTMSQNKVENMVFLEMCVGEADHVFGVGMHEEPTRAGYNSVVSAIDRAVRIQLLPSLKVS